MKVIGRIRINKTSGQKTVTIPKQKETEDWKEGEFVKIEKAEIK